MVANIIIFEMFAAESTNERNKAHYKTIRNRKILYTTDIQMCLMHDNNRLLFIMLPKNQS